jgi:DNA-directed RNA polymerase specialized sigma24 family protein
VFDGAQKNKLDTSAIEKTEFLLENKDEENLVRSLEKEKELEKLENAIGQLKEEQRHCVELFYLKKKSYDQIVKDTGYDLKKVKSYIQNGKRNLKLILDKDSEI